LNYKQLVSQVLWLFLGLFY